MTVRRPWFAAAGLAVVLALSACSSSSSGNNNHTTPPATQPAGGSSASTSGPTITIKGFGYSGTLTVKAGTKVTVVNHDSVAHTLTDKKTQKFDTGSIAGSGGTGSFTAPSAPGTYPFGCTFHPEMAGTLTVTS